MEDVIAKLGIKGIHFVIGLIGGAVALIFGKKRNTILDKIHALGVVIAGAVATGYITPLVFLWSPSLESAEHGIAFFIGIMGMGVIEGLLNVVNKFKIDPLGTIKNSIDVFRKK
tara:strand:- start:101 stop:442 length:342 start_codon:yes stop_codon:yes gene_type:complete